MSFNKSKQKNKSITKTLTRVVDVSTWAGVFENGLPIEKDDISPNQMICKCYQCVENRENSCDSCDLCGLIGDVKQYNSVFSENGSILCPTCYQCEACPGCGWESSGLCRYCRRDS
jgi:hypothetical protein